MIDDISFLKGLNFGGIISAFILGMIAFVSWPVVIITWWAFVVPLVVMLVIDTLSILGA